MNNYWEIEEDFIELDREEMQEAIDEKKKRDDEAYLDCRFI